MNTIMSTLLNGVKYIATMNVADIIDVIVMTFLIYKFLMLLRRTNTLRLAKGIVLLLVLLGLSSLFNLRMLKFLINRGVELGLIALVIIFQPELRRVLEKMGSSSLTSYFGNEFRSQYMENAITQTVLACADLSRTRTGALIIFQRVNSLADSIRTGTVINADVTAELLKNIFFVKAPLHDGAVIVCDGRITAAGCMLPMSGNLNLSKDLGMRHRAGIGISEQTDAVVVIVSEETGAISVAVEGMLKRHLSPETVETLLRRELVPDVSSGKRRSLIEFFKVKKNGK